MRTCSNLAKLLMLTALLLVLWIVPVCAQHTMLLTEGYESVNVTVPPAPLAPASFATIGTGTTIVDWPYYTLYEGSRTQMLYTAAQLSAAGAIAGNLTSVGFNIASYSSQIMTGFTVKMGSTTATSLTAFVPGLTSVYAVDYTVPGSGWRDIILTTPFAWDGTSNVIVEICFWENGVYTSSSTALGTETTGTVWHFHTDNYAGCTGSQSGFFQGRMGSCDLKSTRTQQL